MILTFGLLSPDKGIEYVIDALPAILDVHPDDRLHRPRRHASARDRARRRDLPAHARGPRASSSASTDNMIFHNRFVSQDELTEFLSAADIYITPYLKPEQITSGTLAYAVGAGKAVISTPYSYARELLADGAACSCRGGIGGDRPRGHRAARRRRRAARAMCARRGRARPRP